MVTLKSNSNSNLWIGGAILFSGRSDPEWILEEEQIEQLIQIWNELPSAPGNIIIPNILGYKGCYISTRDKKKWITFRGKVTYYENNEAIESRIDTGRVFEKKIIATAPKDVIPKAMLIEEFE
jgi:hypothetical protein